MFTTGVRNVGQGIGAIITPVLNNLQWIIAALIAHEGWEKVVELWTGFEERRAESQEALFLANYQAYLDTTADDPILTYEEWKERQLTRIRANPLDVMGSMFGTLKRKTRNDV